MDDPAGIRPIDAFTATATGAAGMRLQAMRRVAPRFRERFLEEGRPLQVETLELATFPYPQKYGLGYASRHPAPYAVITHRCHLVRYRDWEGVNRVLLFNPTHVKRSRAAPFFATMIARYGSKLAEEVLSTVHATLESRLLDAAVSPEQVDYLAFDHLHVQDVRAWLGTETETPGEERPLPAFFPRARLLTPAAEWEATRELHPLQRHWYVHGGVDGIPDDRVVPLQGDVSLGPGVALLATPGHTLGNQTLAFHHGDGRVTCVSENGISADNYAPKASRIPGLRQYAAHFDVEVVMNANTLESSLEQYTSMIKERLVAGPVPDHPDFWDVMPSSELTSSMLAPGLNPTYEHRRVSVRHEEGGSSA